MDMQIFFWNEGLTDKFLSLTFDRDDIQYLRNDLYLIIKEIDKEDSKIREMIEKGNLMENYA